VSLDGDRAVVGAIFDDGAADESGTAYVFRLDDNGTPLDPADDFWVEEAKLTASDGAYDDKFGARTSIDGERVVVGAHGDDDAGTSSGSAYVFRLDNNGTPLDPSDDFWIEETRLTASDADPVDDFGWSVSISGNRVVVGSLLDDDAGNRSGAAYVFRRDDAGTPLDPGDDGWVQEAKLIAADAASGNLFGSSVAISDDRVVVGARDDDDVGRGAGSGGP
jgi:hypothetical protein